MKVPEKYTEYFVVSSDYFEMILLNRLVFRKRI